MVLHVAPEAAVGGPLAVIRDGDEIALNVATRSLQLLVSAEELETRLAKWREDRARHKPRPKRGYAQLYHDRVLQADKGTDFDFLTAA